MGKIQQPSDTSLERSLETLELGRLATCPTSRPTSMLCEAPSRANVKVESWKFDACDAALAHAVSGSGPNIVPTDFKHNVGRCWKSQAKVQFTI
jgi:hypothetical protein